MNFPKIDLSLLTGAERLLLLDHVWESFRLAPDSLALTDAQCRELDRREAAYDAGTMPTRSW